MKELTSCIIISPELIVRYFGYNSFAKIKTLEVSHHTNFGPVVVIHFTTDFQATNILNMVDMIQYFCT